MATIILQTEEEKQLWKSIAIGVASSANATDKSSMYGLGRSSSRIL